MSSKHIMPPLSETLREVLALNQRATQEMLHQRYASASELLTLALSQAKQNLAHACYRESSSATTGEPSSSQGGGRVDVELGVSWEPHQALTTQVGYMHTAVVRQPIVLRLCESQGAASSAVNGELFRKVSFGIILNMAISCQMQALFHREQEINQPSSTYRQHVLLRKAMQLYRLAGDMFPRPSPQTQERSPLEMILLNNLGEAFLDQESRQEADLCFQHLCVAIAAFKGNHYLNTSTTGVNQDLKSLVDAIHGQVQWRLLATATAAPMA